MYALVKSGFGWLNFYDAHKNAGQENSCPAFFNLKLMLRGVQATDSKPPRYRGGADNYAIAVIVSIDTHVTATDRRDRGD